MKNLEAAVGDADVVEVETRNPEENLRPFLEEAGLVKDEMATIRDLLAQAANEERKLTHEQDVRRALRDGINSQISEVLDAARLVRDRLFRERLEGIDRAKAANRSVSGCCEGTQVDRIRTSVTNWLCKKLKELMMNFQRLRQRMMANYRKEVGRRYFTLTGQILSEDVMDSDGNNDMLLTRGFCSSEQDKVIEALSEVQHRCDVAKDVEKSLLELHRVILDIKMVVDRQSEVMDNIEYNVSRAAGYIRGGTKEFNSAKIYESNHK